MSEVGMFQVLLEVYSSTLPFTVAVRAESLLRAVDVTKNSYPGSDVRVVFPIDPEEFFVREVGTSEAAVLDAQAPVSEGPVAFRQEGGERE
jgi:hypothetical protein